MDTVVDAEVLGEILSECAELLEVARTNVAASRPDVDGLFRSFHTIKGLTAMGGLEPVRQIAHATESGLQLLRNAGGTATARQRALLEEAIDLCGASFEAHGEAPEGLPAFGERLTEAFDLDPEALPALLRAAAVAPEAPAARQAQVEMVRVPLPAVDDLMNIAGEVLLLEQRLRHATRAGASEAGLRDVTYSFGLLARRLYEHTVALRRTPVAELQPRLERVVREAARVEGKRAVLMVEGDNLLLDRPVVAVLVEPLVHILRNGVSHGVEAPNERRAKGKPVDSRIVARFFERDDQVVVSVRDDGRGIDPARVLRKAIERGVVTAAEGERMSESAIMALIFAPGFSTAEVVNENSGREQVLHSALGAWMNTPPWVADAFHLGDGGLGFTLDVPRLLAFDGRLSA